MAVSLLSAARVALVWCCVVVVVEVVGFNLEPRIPIVKVGSPHSHFGYSVAQHKSSTTSTGGQTSKSWILVGAPKDHNLQPGTNRSGALWKCPLTTLTRDCTQVETDGYRSSSDLPLSRPSEDEIKDDQWLGVTLKSQGPGGKVLVCAHRYIHKGPDFQWGFGLCYILTDDLEVEENLEPCRGKPVDNGHMQYGFCQAGTSGMLVDDEAVLGVPGPFTWRGTVHTSNISDDFLLKDKTQYFGPVTEKDSPVQKFSYLGYSVTAGRFFGNYMSYVGGAPRAQETGQVVFLTREKIGNSLLRVDLILSGEMFASSFGYEVLALDINGDERDDLVVGAPFYHNRKASGAIYVYMNNDGGFQENHPYTRIEGAPGESRFGSSMTSLGDLNHDGYLDVAVGAPYEGKGVIYIFLGTKDGLSSTPAQVIRAEDMPGEPYNAFGYSLSGGMDLDNNGYPDLLTSSFCSDRVLLLRARPIIEMKTKVVSDQLHNIDPTKKGCREDITSPETCFSFDVCFKMDNDAGTRTGLRLNYTIEERVYQDRPLARVRFSDSHPNEPSEVHRKITLQPDDMGISQCSREVVYLMEGSADILRPLRFKLTFEIIQREPKPVAEGEPLPDINEYPILNQKGAVREFEGTFAKDCGNDELCFSDLHLTGSLDLERDVTGKHYLLRLGEQDTVPLLVEVTNSEEPAYESTLIVNHNEALIFDPTESEIGTYQCSAPLPGVIKCGLDNPLVNTTGPLQLSFKESGKVFDSKFIYFSVLANSSSTELTPQEPLHFEVEVIKRAEISIKGDATPEQVFYGGEVVGESAIKHLDEIGTEVTHKYVVDNRGPWRLDELQVEVLWPYQVENGKEKGKWLLYMTEYPTVDGVGECDIDPSLVNPLNLRRSTIYPETYTGHEVDLEPESTDDLKPITDDPLTPGTGVSGTGTKVSKTTTTTKVTTSTYKKTSYEKEILKNSTGSTSGKHSTSTSSSSSSHSSFGGYEDNEEGSGYDGQGSRVHGRTHSRISRRVYSSSDRSKFDENELGGETTKDDDDGRVITHYERTHHTSGKSPDGKSTFEETRHESKKVTVSENTYTDGDDVPRSRWQQGGYRRTHTENRSSSRTFDGEPEETHRRWETSHAPTGQDENRWGEDGSSVRGEESWKKHSRTYSESSTGRTHSGQLGEDHYHRTHEGGAVTQTLGNDNYFDSDRGRTRNHDRTDDRQRFGWSSQNERTPYNRGTEREGRYESSHTDVSTGGRGGSGQHATSDGDYERRVSSSQWTRNSYEDRVSGTHDSQGYANQDGHDRRYGGETRTYADIYDEGRDRYGGNYGETARYRGQSESQRSVWDSHSSSQGSSRHQDVNERHSGGSSEHLFGHLDSDGALENGTYTRVEVDPKTGKTRTYSRKVVFSQQSKSNPRWASDDSLHEERDLFTDERSARTKREKELIIKPQAVTDEKTGKTMQVVHLRCDGPATAKCFAFRCNIRNLAAGRTASIHIKSRLWNSTLVEDYPRVSSVSIKSKAFLILPEDIRKDQDEEDDVASAETQAYPDLLDQLPPEEVPLWVILVSIFAGLLVLIIIVLVLWKLGFFERRRPDPTLSGNLDKDANGY